MSPTVADRIVEGLRLTGIDMLFCLPGVQTDDFSPSQIGEPSTRMSANFTRSYSAGHASLAAPCSVMSG